MKDFEPVDAGEVVQRYQSVVHSIARSIVRNSPVVSHEDLEQEGMTAIVAAVETYDASAGSFSSYIRTCIRNAMIAEANKCCGVFTIDPRIRLQVNKIVRLRNLGYEDNDIMRRLGINNRRRFYTLTALVDTEVYTDTEAVTDDGFFYDVNSIMDALDEIGLSDREISLVQLLIAKKSKPAILKTMSIDNAGYRQLCSSITNKVRDWGRTG